MQLDAALCAGQRGEQADRAGAQDECRARLPYLALVGDVPDLLKRLGNDAGWFRQHAAVADGTGDLHGVGESQPVAFRAVPVLADHAALGVAAIGAHVVLASRALCARLRVGMPAKSRHEVTGLESALAWRLADPAERFVADDQLVRALGGGTEGSGRDFSVGPADAKQQAIDKQLTVPLRGVWYFLEPDRTGLRRVCR